ncbi:MAG: hypothetical protein KatS3mg057_1358 [Herpetosiphonaceae bacterium]|nr:MAG: hypothetical protein KatS3mg057_1358 [Herpetosiphonaceae bacterium]
MEHLERSVEVDVPVRTAYNQWTQFEEFPRFMPGLQRVLQLDDKHIRWETQISGVEKEWEAEITEQLPDRQIAWHSTRGAPNRGVVLFEPTDPMRTRITVRLDYDPEGVLENIGSTLGVVSRYVENALSRFKSFIEARGTETGAWRGEIHGDVVQPGGSDHLLQESNPRPSRERASGDVAGEGDIPATGAPLPHAYGTSGDLRSDTPGATTGAPRDEDRDEDATSRMAQMSGGRHGGTESPESAEGTGPTAFRGERTGRTLPGVEGYVDSDIPPQRDRS